VVSTSPAIETIAAATASSRELVSAPAISEESEPSGNDGVQGIAARLRCVRVSIDSVLRLLAAFMLGCLLMCRVLSAQPAGSAPGQAVIRATAQEVLLDLVVRDNKERLVRNLKPGEIEVYEDGVRREIRSFRFVSGRSAPQESARETAPAAGAQPMQVIDLQPEVNLVSLVYTMIKPADRMFARQAGMEFLRSELPTNTYVAVFSLDHRLNVLQHFTRDRDLLRKAVDRAATGQYSEFRRGSEAVERELRSYVGRSGTGALTADVARVATNSPERGPEAGMAMMMLNAMRFEQEISESDISVRSLMSIASLVQSQSVLPGRKTVLYISNGLYVHPDRKELLDAAVSAANRANVSVYALDAKGLQVGSDASGIRDGLAAAAASAQAQQRHDGYVTREQMMLNDSVRRSIQMNTQLGLSQLAEGTGGFLIANTNVLRAPMRRIGEDIATHYELAYRPASDRYDGHFRRIQVKVLRPGLKVQSRTGYFALPPLRGHVLLPFELPLLHALGESPLPRAFDYRAGTLQFRRTRESAQCVMVFELPIRNVTLVDDLATKSYRTRVSFLALIKDAGGEVVEKIGRDVPFSGPLDKREAFRRGNFIYTQPVVLPAGRYTVETAVLDRESMKTSAKKVAVVVPRHERGVALSSLTLVRSADPVAARNPADPLEFRGGKVTPTLADEAQTKARPALYFVIYPDSDLSEKPDLAVDYLQDGEVVLRATPALDAPDEDGSIAFLAMTPEELKPGQYVIRATVRQGASSAEETKLLTLK
jgi:VWFA-related protein